MAKDNVPIEALPLSNSKKPLNIFLVLSGVFLHLPIAGLIFAIIAYKEAKKEGQNVELSLILMIQSIIVQVIVILFIFTLVLELVPVYESIETDLELK